MIALACCENMPVAMDDVIIPKTAVAATITTNSRKFILSILYYHNKIYSNYTPHLHESSLISSLSVSLANVMDTVYDKVECGGM
jgi:hypothetical protein